MPIQKAYGKEVDTNRLHHYEKLAGNGICMQWDQQELLIGNYKLMQGNHIAYEECTALGTIAHVVMDGVYEGYIVIDDEIKETGKEAIVSLKQQNERWFLFGRNHEHKAVGLLR